MWHDTHILAKHFKPGHQVLLYNSRLKLKSRWSRPYTVTQVFPYGPIEFKNEKNESQFNVNGHSLKQYHGGEVIQFTSSIPPTLEWPEPIQS